MSKFYQKSSHYKQFLNINLRNESRIRRILDQYEKPFKQFSFSFITMKISFEATS